VFREVLNNFNVFKNSVLTSEKQSDINIKSSPLLPFWKISLVVLRIMKILSTFFGEMQSLLNAKQVAHIYNNHSAL
jgi:hypothetical protein